MTSFNQTLIDELNQARLSHTLSIEDDAVCFSPGRQTRPWLRYAARNFAAICVLLALFAWGTGVVEGQWFSQPKVLIVAFLLFALVYLSGLKNELGAHHKLHPENLHYYFNGKYQRSAEGTISQLMIRKFRGGYALALTLEITEEEAILPSNELSIDSRLVASKRKEDIQRLLHAFEQVASPENSPLPLKKVA